MSLMNKRERSVNFTREETELLLKLVSKNKHILENKISNASTWNQKENCWKRIEEYFNRNSGSNGITYRSAKTLKIKYDGMKRDARKKSALLRAKTCKTEEGPSSAPSSTPTQEKTKDMILLSVDESENSFDSDQVTDTVFIKSDPLQTPPIAMIDGPNDVMECNMLEDEKEFVPPSISHTSCVNSEPSMVKIPIDINNEEDKWSHWKPITLRSKKHAILSKLKAKQPFKRVAESKLHLVDLQKTILEDEIANKRKQWLFEERAREEQQKRWDFEEAERVHKKELWVLEKEILLQKLKLEKN